MKKMLTISLVVSLAVSALSASSVDELGKTFEEGKLSGELRSVATTYNYEGDTDVYSLALGASLKYETAEFNGVNVGLGFINSKDLQLETDDTFLGEFSRELSSSDGEYTELNEVYFNYSKSGFNLRIGRQVVDTPLADSDDIRMIINTFEAYIATYKISGFSLMAGNLLKWQGTDAGLDDGWVKSGEDGTKFASLTYSLDELIEASAWYYNIPGSVNATYLDATLNYALSDGISFALAAQYLKENELDNSGEAADIYGASLEVSLYDMGVNLAYNKSAKVEGKASFSGFGGGTLFTSMDTMILDEITNDRDATAIVAGLSYSLSGVDLSYAYGDFSGEKDGSGDTAHIIEQNIGVEYAASEELTLLGYFIMQSDGDSSTQGENDWNRIQASVIYNF